MGFFVVVLSGGTVNMTRISKADGVLLHREKLNHVYRGRVSPIIPASFVSCVYDRGFFNSVISSGWYRISGCHSLKGEWYLLIGLLLFHVLFMSSLICWNES